jgi:hypothetical protein
MLHRLAPLVLFATALFAQTPQTQTPQTQTPEAPPVAKAPAPALQLPAAATAIDRKDLLAYATYLASDDLRGRLTGSAGQLAAATYIEKHFASLGLEPLGDEVDGKRGFRQSYDIARTYVTPATKLEFGALALTDGFAVLGGRKLDIDVASKVRFCGFGILSGDDADVPADESLQGKVAVVVIKTPRRNQDTVLSMERKFTMSLSTFQRVGQVGTNLEKRGVAAVVFVLVKDTIGLSDVLTYLAPAPGHDVLAPRFPGGDSGMSRAGSTITGTVKLPTVVLSVPASAKVLAELGIGADAAAAFVGGEGERPKSKDDVAAHVKIGVARDETATACNVVAVLRGSDPQLASEAVVYSAHMDHVGVRIDGDVYNGADDNASGTAGLLGIATAYAKSKQKPRRSVIFLSVSGEELGLWGSAWFADHPPWDAKNIVADVNTDMIGRSGPESGPNQVMVTPSFHHKMFSTIVQDGARFAEALGCSLVNGDKYYQRSDHYNFAKKGIPVVFFCNGEHEDYHQVTDTADKLDAEKMERFARLAFWTGWSVANADERPKTLGKSESWY